MRTFEPKSNFGDGDNKNFDPLAEDGITMRCCCGYSLHKETEDTWRCEGGNHRYHISQGDVTLDKYGNMLFKLPENSQ